MPRYNLEGYAAGAVTGGGNIPDSDRALSKGDHGHRTRGRAARGEGVERESREGHRDHERPQHGLERSRHAADLAGRRPAARRTSPPKKHPALIASGVTLLDIQDFSGLTIFSRNGATIRHAEFNIKNGTNLILRNLRFDELWEWDEGTRGDYDSNDWDFVTIGDGGGVTSGIWVDHCTFTKAYDGVLDIKKGASNITISWSDVVPAATGPGSFVQQQFDDARSRTAPAT